MLLLHVATVACIFLHLWGGGTAARAQASQKVKKHCKRIRKARKQKTENKRAWKVVVVATREWARRDDEYRETFNTSFSSLSPQSSLCLLSIEPERGRRTNERTSFFFWLFSPKNTDTARLVKQIEKTKRERHPHRSCTAPNELPDKIYNRRIGESLEIENTIYHRISLTSLEASLLLWPILRKRSS